MVNVWGGECLGGERLTIHVDHYLKTNIFGDLFVSVKALEVVKAV